MTHKFNNYDKARNLLRMSDAMSEEMIISMAKGLPLSSGDCALLAEGFRQGVLHRWTYEKIRATFPKVS